MVYELYTVVPQETERSLCAEKNAAGDARIFGNRRVFLEKRPYPADTFAALTAFVSNWYYEVCEEHTEWVGNADPTPYTYRNDPFREPVLPTDVVVANGAAFGLLQRSPYSEDYQVVTCDRFAGCHFSFRDPAHSDADNRISRETILRHR